MHDWVVSTKDNLDKFKMEFEDYFDMHFCLIYYVYTFFALMVDQRAKNMFLTYWGETGKWQPFFYDNDTSFGINNEGQLVLDYYHTDTDQLEGANVYNGQNSVLWCNFRDAFPDEIKKTYQDLRSNGVLNYDELIAQFITNGSDKWSESIYNEDADFKYISMLETDGDASNLDQVRGTGEEHFRYFVKNRLNYCDGRWYAGDYPDDYVALRIYTPQDENGNPRTDLAVAANANITVTPYSHMYAGVRYKANGTLYQKRVSANEVTTFEAPNETFNDTETAIYGASQLSSLGDLSPLYCGSINVSSATKLTELIIGNGTEGYSNPNLKSLSVGTNNLLKELNVRNCTNLTDPLALSGCPNIEEIYAAGSGITGVELAKSGYLKTIELPATIANLTLTNQLYIESLTLEGYDAIKTINIENCPTIDCLDILSKATNVERVRLTNVNWTYDTAAGVLALADRNLAGIDENGANIDYMWIDGKCHIKTLTGAEYLEVKEAFPYMTITYDTLTAQLIFMSEDGNTELTRQTIQNGGNGTDPVTAGTISRPSKTSTAQYNFTYSGWSLTSGGVADANALKNVEADRTVYVAFSKELRSYTVKFYNGSTLLQTSTVQYGGDAVYSGSTPVNNSTGNPADFEFYGWKPAPTNIQGDTSCYAQFHDLREITDSWETIAAAVADGTATDKYAIGAFKMLDIGEVSLPYEFNQGSAVLYNGEIHILGSVVSEYRTSHYKWDGTKWVEVSTLPYEFYYGSAVVFNGEIHILGGSGSSSGKKKHYKWNGSEWVSVSTLPYMFRNGVVVVYNNEIHIMGSEESSYYTSHYKWNGSSWSEVGELPYSFYTASGFIYNNEIHMLGSYDSKYNTAHYKYDGSSWISVSTLPQKLSNGHALVIGTDIYMIQWDEFYKYDGTNWDTCPNVPANVYEGGSVVLDGNIYVMGSSVSGNERVFYSYDTETSKWSKVGITESIPMQIVAHNHDELPDGVGKWEGIAKPTNIPQYGCAVTYQNEVHALGGNSSSSYTQHIKWDTTNSTWATVSMLPYKFRSGCALVLNDEIHILGSYQTTNKTEHYKWNATDGWVSVSTLPYSFYCSSAVVLNNEIHILGSYDSSCRKYHYKWNGSTWTSVSTLPYNFYYGSAVVYNGEIHIFSGSGSSTGHYKWDGSAWTSVSTLPYNLQYGVATIINNEIHIFGGSDNPTGHYKWNGTEWTSMTTLPGNFENYPLAVCNGTPYIFISTSCYKLAGARWVEQPYEFTPYNNSSCCVIHRNELHIIGGYSNSTGHYKTDGITKTDMGTTPISFTSAMGISYNDEIHVFSSSVYYKWNETDGWAENGSLPFTYNGNNCRIFIYNNEIHAYSATNHYKFDGTDWVQLGTIPRVTPVVYNLNGELYNINYAGGKFEFYKFDGSEWTSINANASVVNANYFTAVKLTVKYKGSSYGVVNKSMFKFDGANLIEFDLLHGVGTTGGIGIINDHLVTWSGYKLYRYENPRATLTFVAGEVLKDSVSFNNSKKTDSYGNTQLCAGGWEISDVRNYLNNTIYNTLPSDLISSIKEVNKYSDKGASYTTEIGTTIDKVWLLSVDEVGGTDHNQAIHGQGEPYPVFSDNASRIRYKQGGEEMSTYMLRSTSAAESYAVFKIDGNPTSAAGARGRVFAEYSDATPLIIGFCI